MSTNREKLIKDCASLLAIYSNYISNLSSVNMNDASIVAEHNMLGIVNYIFNMNFEDVNKKLKHNYPGIDYLDEKMKIGMQVTRVATVAKIKESINKLIKNTSIHVETMQFLFLINKSYYPEIHNYKEIKIVPITLQSIFKTIVNFDDYRLGHVRQLLESLRISPGLMQTSMIEQAIPPIIPLGFARFAAEVDRWITNQFRVTNPSFNYLFDKILFTNSMVNFINELHQIPRPMRSLIASIIILASPANRARERLRVDRVKLYYSLPRDTQPYLNDYVEYLQKIGLLLCYCDNYRIDETKNNEIDTHLKCDAYIEISYLIDQLDLDIFTALSFFYLEKHTTKDLYYAIENVDFKLLE
ncbi:SMEK domain-containing protein [Providencia rettgeri]|uniref:SMEK domain-containing protein n=1 Tax=Providencia sp. PROV110 TaxID=2949821 RepID=UPI002349987C|nr:SMEK domain-containing protein [Providencia sp. PROV110]ELR5239452.1 SMEK domain-containing protein [Providencia rettgeri]HEC8347507.1 SMEK domain-containing protein [Providencia rettgeri]